MKEGMKIEWEWKDLGYKITLEGSNGVAMVRDLDGKAIHAAHILNLVKVDKVREHRAEEG